jgi:Sulfotransferase family
MSEAPSSPVSPAPVKVLFVGGYTRSGSTMLDRMLGQIDGFTSTGELGLIWTHGVQENRLCGCGAPFFDCPFWRRVGDEAFGGWERVDLDEMLALSAGVNRHRFVPFMLAPALHSGYRRRLRAYGDVLSRLYGAIATVSGSRVIVDSTKDPSFGFLLRHVPGIDLRVLHLTRDSRGTAFSWMRHVVRHDVVDREVEMQRFRPWITALRWDVYHVLLHLLSRLVGPPLTVRYEDLVRDPRAEIERVAAHAGEDLDGHVAPGRFRPGVVELEVGHTVAGNLMRMRQGPLRVRVDDEWRTGLGRTQRVVVTLLSWPLLARYGYLAETKRSEP